MCAENRLNTISNYNYAGGAQSLEFVAANFGNVLYLNSKSRDACIKTDNVRPSPKSANQRKYLEALETYAGHAAIALSNARLLVNNELTE